MPRERQYTLETLPTYATLDELLKWPKEELANLHRQCQEGRKCYIVDAQGFTGLWFEDAYTERGELR